MGELLLSNEPWVRLSVFLVLFVAMVLWEVFAPRRSQSVPRRLRWPGNLGIVVLNSALLRVLLPAGAVGFASYAQTQGWGVLNALHVPAAVAVPVSIVLLDLAIYLQHVVFHAVPALWRLHRMHHADLEFDVTTGSRFHPLEIGLSMGIKLAVIAALGPPALAVLLFEVLLNATAMFNHGNVRIAAGIDRVMRWVLVTPDMHRIHHSIEPRETNSNFGFNLPWWDRLFGTYRADPSAGQTGMTIGLAEFRTPDELRLGQMLVQPFRDPRRNPLR